MQTQGIRTGLTNYLSQHLIPRQAKQRHHALSCVSPFQIDQTRKCEITRLMTNALLNVELTTVLTEGSSDPMNCTARSHDEYVACHFRLPLSWYLLGTTFQYKGSCLKVHIPVGCPSLLGCPGIPLGCSWDTPCPSVEGAMAMFMSHHMISLCNK